MLKNFEIIRIGLVIKPPKPNKVIFLFNKNNGVTYKIIFKI